MIPETKETIRIAFPLFRKFPNRDAENASPKNHRVEKDDAPKPKKNLSFSCENLEEYPPTKTIVSRYTCGFNRLKAKLAKTVCQKLVVSELVVEISIVFRDSFTFIAQ